MPTVEPPREDLRADFEAIVKHANAFEEDEAGAVLERISTKVAGDRELAFATFLALAQAFREITLEHGVVSETKRAELTERLAYLAAFRDGYAKPSWCILTAIPVWPPEAELPNNITRAALRTAYVDVLQPPDLAQAVRRLFNLFAK